MKKSMKDKIADYMRRKAEEKREQQRLKYSKEYQPTHPDNN